MSKLDQPGKDGELELTQLKVVIRARNASARWKWWLELRTMDDVVIFQEQIQEYQAKDLSHRQFSLDYSQ